MANTVVLALDRFPIDSKTSSNQETTNYVFFVIFVGEMLVKMLGNGLKLYFDNNFNIFDFIVILFSLVDIVLENIQLS